MAARFAPDDWERRAEIVGRAEELRARVEPLADADAEAYGAFMADRSDANVERIVAIPFELAEIAAEVAELAAARRGRRATRTSAATPPPAQTSPRRRRRSRARLVAINAAPDDDASREARALAARAARAAGERPLRDVS